jgi:acetyl-CoA C-acetyltransferase
VTGGLPFFGGPGSNYLTHSIAAMAQTLREDPGSLGLVSGVGMHMTKHVFGVYSTTPGAVQPPEEVAIDAAPVEIADRHEGPATIATYTVAHARSGEPEWGLAICDLPDGRRAYARVDDVDLLEQMERTEWVGETVTLVPAPGSPDVNLVKA